MASYRVVWEIDVDADTPEDAALLAAEIMADPGSCGPVFEVRAESESEGVTIDTEDLWAREEA